MKQRSGVEGLEVGLYNQCTFWKWVIANRHFLNASKKLPQILISDMDGREMEGPYMVPKNNP